MSTELRREPVLALGQLEIPLPGVLPLTDEERVQRWLKEHDDETRERLAGILLLTDAESRSRRARRWAELRAIQAPFDSDWGWLIHGGVEAPWLYDEATRCFVSGYYLAALLCAHAACERALAGSLEPYREELDRNWTRWGLGPLIDAAYDRGLIGDGIRAQLFTLTQFRKVSAHYKPPLTPDSVMNRAIAHPKNGVLDDEELLDEVLRADALFALRVSTAIIRGGLGFNQVTLG